MREKPNYLVSFCLAQEGDLGPELKAISALASFCNERLQYWEIVYVAGEAHRSAIQAAFHNCAAIKNLRILLVRDAVGYYRRRTIAADEAIGDVVVITCFNEMVTADLLLFAEEALASNRVVIGRRSGKGVLPPLAYSVIGLISQFRVDARDLKTIVLPRNHLVSILARPTAPIDLRFEPKRGVAPYLRRELYPFRTGGEAGLKQRLELLANIFSTSAGRFLSIFALVAAVVSALAAAYGLYAVAVFLLRENVQAGWFSTAIAQSGSTAFLALGLAVIALGIANIVDRLEGATRHEIIDEIGNINFLDRADDLNVQIGSDAVSLMRNDP
jgi:hypothetical protein